MKKSKSNLDKFTEKVMQVTKSNIEIAQRAQADWSRYDRKVRKMTVDGQECMVVF